MVWRHEELTELTAALGEALRGIEPGEPVMHLASFLPVGGKRDVLRFALRELHRVAPAPTDIIGVTIYGVYQ